MKIVYVGESQFENIINAINLDDFFRENKLVILSKYPYAAIPEASGIFRKILENHLNYDIMYIALGNLAYILNEKKQEILNYGPGFLEKDLIEFPINYYQQKENKKVSSISFYYQHYCKSKHFSKERLDNYLHEIGINNKKILEYVDINFEEYVEKSMINAKQRKMLLMPHYNIFFDNEKIKESLKMYLEDGNFLTLLTFTGSNCGFPFSVNIGDILTTKKYDNQYKDLINFFNNLDIEDDQVTNFKTSFTGINYRENCYNFGFSHNNINKFFEIWLNYLKNKGYNIEEIYYLGQNINNIKMINDIKIQYLLNDNFT